MRTAIIYNIDEQHQETIMLKDLIRQKTATTAGAVQFAVGIAISAGGIAALTQSILF